MCLFLLIGFYLVSPRFSIHGYVAKTRSTHTHTHRHKRFWSFFRVCISDKQSLSSTRCYCNEIRTFGSVSRGFYFVANTIFQCHVRCFSRNYGFQLTELKVILMARTINSSHSYSEHWRKKRGQSISLQPVNINWAVVLIKKVSFWHPKKALATDFAIHDDLGLEKRAEFQMNFHHHHAKTIHRRRDTFKRTGKFRRSASFYCSLSFKNHKNDGQTPINYGRFGIFFV